MCALTHFACPSLLPSPRLPETVGQCFDPAAPVSPRFQVVLAGNAFFHIVETSTGNVRGFRSNHNEACALARALELRH